MGKISSFLNPSFSCHSHGVGMFFSAASEICQSFNCVAS